MIKAVFTLDFDAMGDAWDKYVANMQNNALSFAKSQKEIMKNAGNEVLNWSVNSMEEQNSLNQSQSSTITSGVTNLGGNNKSSNTTEELKKQKETEKKQYRLQKMSYLSLLSM